MSFREVDIRMDVERWASIPYYQHYEVSNFGRVRRDGHRIMKQGVNTFGYKHVWLCEEGCLQSHQVHRLVAFAFVRKRDPDMAWVVFKDGNKDNLRADNLEWKLRSGSKFARCMEEPDSPERAAKVRVMVRNLAFGGWKIPTLMERFELSEAQVMECINSPKAPKEKARTLEERVHAYRASKYRVETIARKLGVPMEDVVEILHGKGAVV